MESSRSPDVLISFSTDPRDSVHPPPMTYSSAILDHSNHEVFNVSSPGDSPYLFESAHTRIVCRQSKRTG